MGRLRTVPLVGFGSLRHHTRVPEFRRHHNDPGAFLTGTVMALPATWWSFEYARFACSRRKGPSALREAGRSLTRALQHNPPRSRPTFDTGDEIRLAMR